ncbi:hypothetical protein CEP53_014171 [Fusarium sp. AF-6]|nr:hypothetical protein CEP53_014171 [Fusarium sp. AF-6]
MRYRDKQEKGAEKGADLEGTRPSLEVLDSDSCTIQYNTRTKCISFAPRLSLWHCYRSVLGEILSDCIRVNLHEVIPSTVSI